MKHFSDPIRDSIYWLLFSVCGLVIPLALGLILGMAITKCYNFDIGDITHGGQFATYSLGMIATSYYILGRQNNYRLPFRQGINFLLYLFLLVTAFSFVCTLIFQNRVPIDSWTIEWPTVIIFAATCVVTFFLVLQDNRQAAKAVDNMKEEEQKRETQMGLDIDAMIRGNK